MQREELLQFQKHPKDYCEKTDAHLNYFNVVNITSSWLKKIVCLHYFCKKEPWPQVTPQYMTTQLQVTLQYMSTTLSHSIIKEHITPTCTLIQQCKTTVILQESLSTLQVGSKYAIVLTGQVQRLQRAAVTHPYRCLVKRHI